MALQTLQGREVLGESGDDDLAHLLRLEQIPQPVLPEVDQPYPAGEEAIELAPDCLGEEHLTPVSGSEQAGQAVEGGDLMIVPPRIWGSLSGMQRHAHPQRSGLRPWFIR